jgi:alpha-L-fucosidase
MLFGNRGAAAAQNEARRVTHRRGRELLELQQQFVDLRFGMFLHFNMATFQDREWGDPASSPDLFHPTGLDTDQWAAAALSANMTWGCLTTRHHDGFCIWPTKTAGASIGQTSDSIDVVRAYVNSFRKAGLRGGALLFDPVAAR